MLPEYATIDADFVDLGDILVSMISFWRDQNEIMNAWRLESEVNIKTSDQSSKSD